MITGAHSIIYSKDPEADRAFFKEVVGLPSVDVGEGWLIFGLPPAEVAVHPARKNGLHEFYLICEDAKDFMAAMKKRKVACSPVQDFGWGLMTMVTPARRRPGRRLRAASRAPQAGARSQGEGRAARCSTRRREGREEARGQAR